jgi:hypothetical protein
MFRSTQFKCESSKVTLIEQADQNRRGFILTFTDGDDPRTHLFLEEASLFRVVKFGANVDLSNHEFPFRNMITVDNRDVADFNPTGTRAWASFFGGVPLSILNSIELKDFMGDRLKVPNEH